MKSDCRAFNAWNLLESDIIQAQCGHNTPLDPLAGLEEIMSRMSSRQQLKVSAALNL